MLKRVGWYLSGFSIGLVFLFFFFKGKRTSCSYFPEERVKKEICSKPIRIEKEELQSFDSIQIKDLIWKSNLIFSKSKPRQEPCGFYYFENDSLTFSVKNCIKETIILSP